MDLFLIVPASMEEILSDIVVGLDIGTNMMRAAVGRIEEDKSVSIIGLAKQKSQGLRNGTIVNIEAAMASIKETIEEAEGKAGAEADYCITVIGGQQIESSNRNGMVGITDNGRKREITERDIQRAIECAKSVEIPMDRDLLHVVPQEFIVDGLTDIKDPVHMSGTRLEAKVHMITASRTAIQNVKECVHRAGYEPYNVMLKTLAACKASGREDELELGSILIDLGAGSTDVLVLNGGAPVCSFSIAVGGNLVTNDIALVERIPIAAAEDIKVHSGCCFMEALENPEGEVVIPGVGGRSATLSSRRKICSIIQPRMEEIFMMVRKAVIHKSNLKRLSGNIILTGGGAQMPGVLELAQNVFRTPAVRLGVPMKMGEDLPEDSYRKPEYATVVGLLEYMKDNLSKTSNRKNKKTKNTSDDQRSVLQKLKDIFF